MATQRPTLVLGVMTHPARWDLRQAARNSWFVSNPYPESTRGTATVARFVIGNGGTTCSKEQLDEAAKEHQQHGDLTFVAAPDCHKGFGAEKVHAWYVHALAAWPGAVWYGKMEDDGILWAASLVRLLEAVPAHVVYVGYLQWQSSCELNLERMPNSDEEQPCAGCWGGYFSHTSGSGDPGRRYPCARVNSYGTFLSPRSPQCPSLYQSPFACGPLEVRRRRLAQHVARCSYANSYFSAMSRRSLTINRTALAPQFQHEVPICATTDGAQGHALGRCAIDDRLEVLDLSVRTQKYYVEMPRNGSPGVLIVHPLKFAHERQWRDFWHRLTATTPFEPTGTATATVSRLNTSKALITNWTPWSFPRSTRARPAVGLAVTPPGGFSEPLKRMS